jgi:hypothetical protein
MSVIAKIVGQPAKRHNDAIDLGFANLRKKSNFHKAKLSAAARCERRRMTGYALVSGANRAGKAKTNNFNDFEPLSSEQ